MDWDFKVDPMWSMLLTQLLWQLPVLLVCVAGMVLALLFWRRCPAASLMVLIAAGALVLAGVGQTSLSTVLIHAGRGSERGFAGSSQILAGIAVVGSIVRAAATGLLAAAAFVGRRRAAELSA